MQNYVVPGKITFNRDVKNRFFTNKYTDEDDIKEIRSRIIIIEVIFSILVKFQRKYT